MKDCSLPSTWNASQAVDHPYLVVCSMSGANAAAARRALAATASASEVPAGAEEDVLNGGMCGVCHDPLEQPVVAGCGHAFCWVSPPSEQRLSKETLVMSECHEAM